MNIHTYNGLDALPSRLRIYGASDYATMEADPTKREPDYTEHGVVGIDAIGDLWFIDWWYAQCETDKGIAKFVELVRQHKPVKWWNEGGIIDKAIKPAIRQAMRLNNAYVSLEALSSLSDKSVKLQAFHARATAGCVHFPVRRKWTDHVIDQLVKFPGGRWDDAADVCGLIGRGVDQMMETHVPVVDRKPLLVPFTGKWLEFNDGSQKPKVRYF